MKGRVLIPLAFGGFLAYFLVQVHTVLLPFMLAATLAYLLNPLVGFFEIRGFKRSVGVVGVYSVFITVLLFSTYFGLYVASQEAAKAASEMPAYVAHVQTLAHRELNPDSTLVRRFPMARQFIASKAFLDWKQQWRRWPTLILQETPSLLLRALPFLQHAVLVPLLLFFFMLEGPAFLMFLLDLLPARYVEIFLNVIIDINHTLGNYVRGICLEALFVGGIALAGFVCIGLDYALQIALLVGLTNVIPFLGPIVAAIVGGFIAFFQWGTLTGFLKVLLICLSIRFLDDTVFQPLVLQHTVRLHPVIIIFTLMSGWTLWGFWGVLFGVPLACMIKVLVEVLWRWYGSLYGHPVPETPHEALHIPVI